MLKAFVQTDEELKQTKNLFELTKALNADQFRKDSIPNLLFLFDWILSIPLSNAGIKFISPHKLQC
jgi:hypothetical protein